MDMEIVVPEYNVNTGLRLCWSDGYSIKISKNDNEVIISANREGLLSLANHLLNLAQKDVPCGAHIHLDEYNSLEDGSLDLIVEKI